MKRNIALVLALIFVLGLCACGQPPKPAEQQPSANVADGAPVTADKEASGTSFEPMTWKFTCSNSDTSTWMQAGKYFGELISEATNGAITIQYYPSDQLTSGSQTEGIQAVMEGTIELAMHSNLIYSSFDDRFSVVSMPFLFDNRDQADAILDGKGGAALTEVLAEHGLRCLGIGENGFRNVTNSKREIKTPDDIKGLVLRVAGSSVLMKAYELWGANYTKANLSEVYTGLQTGTYDGQENPLRTMESESFNEVQKYMTRWTGSYDCIFFSMNAELYNSLSPELQAIVDECGKKAAQKQRELNRSGDDELVAGWVKNNGMVVHDMSTEEAAAFKSLSKPVGVYYAQLLKDNGLDEASVANYLAAFGVDVS